MAIYDRIEINPKVMMGKPVILGTRIPVELILRKLSEKATEADLLQAYPQLVAGDIQAAIRFAADTIAHTVTIRPMASGKTSCVRTCITLGAFPPMEASIAPKSRS